LNIEDDKSFAFNLEDRINKKYDYKISSLKPVDNSSKYKNEEMIVDEPRNDQIQSKKINVEMTSQQNEG